MTKKNSALLLGVVLLPCLALAQSGNATIRGMVQDPSGAVIPGAQVVATNIETGVARSTVTTTAGFYVLPNLIPGTYQLQVRASTFRPKTVADIKLVIDQQAGINISLEAGTVAQEVTVSTTQQVLQTEDASVGTVIQNEQVTSLPLNGRSFTQLLQLVPGTVAGTRNLLFRNSDPIQAGHQRNGMAAFDVNGGSGAWTNFRVDGIENQEREFGGASVPVSVDAIQEVKLQTANFSAEYGRSPAQVDVVTKAGTNQFHGTLFEFLRNDALDAAQWTPTGLHPELQLKRNQFGGNIGGPLVKNKLFFFFNYDGTREVFSSPRTVDVPTDEMRNGVFPSGVIIFDPQTGQPFPNNTIPASRIDPVAKLVQDMVLPAPNGPGIPQENAAGFDLTPTDNYFYDPKRTFTINQYIGRVDYNHSESDSFNFRYIYSSNFRRGDGPLATALQNSIVGFETADLGGQNYTGTWYHNFSPTTINEFRAGFATNPQKYFKGDTSDWAQTLGVKQFLNSSAYTGLPHFQIGSVNLSSGDFRPLQTGEINLQIVDNMTLIRGRHQIRFGEDVRRTILDTQNNEVSTGQFFFNGAQTRDRNFPTQGTTPCPGGVGTCTAGNGFADFLLGYLSSFQAGDPIPPTRKYFTSWGGYINDSWRIRDTFTLNLGVRYEYTTRWHADPPQFGMPIITDGVFTGTVAVASQDGKMGPRVRQDLLAAFPGVVALCKDVGLPESCLISDKNNVQPRVGFAWQITPKTVLRGGAGIFYGVYFGDLDTEDGSFFPYISALKTQTFTSPPSGTDPPPLLMSNPLAAASAPAPTIQTTGPEHPMPGTGQWNLSVQREIMQNTSVTASYVGSIGRHLEEAEAAGWYQYNVPEPWGVVLAPGQQRAVPDPRFAEIWRWYNDENSHYESLQAKLERRFSRGLNLTGSYTFSKNLIIHPRLSDPRNPYLDRGPSSNDVTHNLVISPVWELPFGTGRRWATDNKVLDQFVGGWRISGIGSWQTGFPFTPTLSGGSLLRGPSRLQNRPNQVCSGSLSHPTADAWFDKSCFTGVTQPTSPGALLVAGNTRLNPLRGPSQFSWDLGLSKTFQLAEKTGLDFRAEFFNVLNHVNLGFPNATITPAGNSPAARISAPTSLPRIMQFALKLHF